MDFIKPAQNPNEGCLSIKALPWRRLYSCIAYLMVTSTASREAPAVSRTVSIGFDHVGPRGPYRGSSQRAGVKPVTQLVKFSPKHQLVVQRIYTTKPDQCRTHLMSLTEGEREWFSFLFQGRRFRFCQGCRGHSRFEYQLPVHSKLPAPSNRSPLEGRSDLLGPKRSQLVTWQ